MEDRISEHPIEGQATDEDAVDQVEIATPKSGGALHGDNIHRELSADDPAVQGFAAASRLEAWKLAAAVSDPEHFLEHLTLEELAKFKVGVDALEVLRQQMTEALQVYMTYTRGVLAGSAANAPTEG